MAIRNVLHFMPGEIVFRVDHDATLNPSEIQTLLAAQPEVSEDRELAAALRQDDPNAVRVLTFDRGEQPGFRGRLQRRNLIIGEYLRFFSLVFVTPPREGYEYESDSENWPRQNKELLRKIIRIDGQIANRKPRPSIFVRYCPQTPVTAERRRSLVYRAASSVFQPPIFEVQAATFNWMGSGAQGQAVPTGGPGTLPVAEGTKTTVKGIEVVNLPPVAQAAYQPVEVFVLDTIPKDPYDRNWIQERINAGPSPSTPFLRWVKLDNHDPAKDNFTISEDATPLPSKLARQVPSAARFMDWLNDLTSGVEICEYDCDMSAHGLFVADIICGVMECYKTAPEHLYLYEVLNQWGVGTLETVARGLMAVINQLDPSRKSVVNCSFTILIPRLSSDQNRVGHSLPGETSCEQEQHRPVQYDDEFRKLLVTLLSGGGAVRTRAVLEPIFDLLKQKGVICVAAAGNEWDNLTGALLSTTRPIARYPAAFGSVTGVAALNEEIPGSPPTMAPYSNRADEPESDGFAVFGGGVQPGVVVHGKGLADSKNSILGLYVGEFCKVTANDSWLPNTSWLAYWSGTSFAAPIITGALAAELAVGSLNALNNLIVAYNAPSPGDERPVPVRK